MSDHRPSGPPPADQLVLDLPGVAVLHLVGSTGPRRRTTSSTPTAQTAVTAATRPPTQHPQTSEAPVGERVWLVWEDEEVLGVYADPDIAAADCATLRRAAHRAGSAIRYECLPVPVFTDHRHQHPPRPGWLAR